MTREKIPGPASDFGLKSDKSRTVEGLACHIEISLEQRLRKGTTGTDSGSMDALRNWSLRIKSTGECFVVAFIVAFVEGEKRDLKRLMTWRTGSDFG